MQNEILNTPNLHVMAAAVRDIVIDDGESPRITGITLDNHALIPTHAVVITTGTFLRGCINLGMDEQKPAGRINDQPAIDLAKSIEKLGFKMGRLKTGRIRIRFSMEVRFISTLHRHTRSTGNQNNWF